jgi:hypothetical protein
MSQQVKTPASAAGYTPATQDPDLRSQINAILIRDGHVSKIQDHLIHALHSHQSDWPTVIQTHALNLLRSGEVGTFPALLRRVLEDIRNDATATATAGRSTNGGGGGGGDSSSGKKAAASAANGAAANGDSSATTGLAMPQNVVDEALKVTRESLEQVVAIKE